MRQSSDEAMGRYLRQTIEDIAQQAANRCGLSHDVYVQIFSASIDERYTDANPELRAAALVIAREHDYASSKEIATTIREMAEEGYCRHGFDSQTCPCGCFEFE